jgi:hypothetical protein
VERLEVVRNTVAGRAHNDWMEWTLEAGLPGWIVLLAVLIIVGTMVWRRLGFELRNKGTLHSRAQAVMAVGILVQLGVHALDDFPVREMSLAGLLAMAAAMLFSRVGPAQRRSRSPSPNRQTQPKTKRRCWNPRPNWRRPELPLFPPDQDRGGNTGSSLRPAMIVASSQASPA